MATFTYFEPLSAGHCAFWARIVLEAASRDPRIDRLRFETNAELAVRLSDLIEETGLELVIMPDDHIRNLTSGRLLHRGGAQWSAARHILGRCGGHLMLPFFDHAVYGALLDRRPVRGTVSGIIFRPPNDFGYQPNFRKRLDAARRWSTYISARRPSLKTLFTLDEGAARASGDGLRHLSFLPDPMPDPSLFAASACSRADGRRWFLIFGALSERKGIFKVLEAARLLPDDVARKTGLRFVGRLDAADRDAFLTQLQRLRDGRPDLAIELEDRFVEDEELAREVVSSDVILAPYQNHVGSSGVVLWAAAAGKPLICQKTGAMGSQVAIHKLGLGVDCTDAQALSDALTGDVEAPKVGNLPEIHSPAGFAQRVLDGCLED